MLMYRGAFGFKAIQEATVIVTKDRSTCPTPLDSML
jgi:hypothetical protein